MKWIQKFFLVLVSYFIFPNFLSAAPPVSEWNEIKSEHFILFYQGNRSAFDDSVLGRAESYYDEIAQSLGYSRRDQFWLWDNRCRIYLYGTKEDFHKTSGQNIWSNGYADLENRTVVSYQNSNEFLEAVLPHELAHLILRDFVGGAHTIPLWLDEGLAMAQEKKRLHQLDQIVQKAIVEQKWIPLQKLAQVRSMTSSTSQEATLFYAEAQSLVRFLLTSRDPARFLQLCRDLRDGASFEKSLQRNYPMEFSSVQKLETKWLAAHE